MENFNTVDEYIAEFPIAIQLIMNDIRSTITKAAPDALEEIAYKMPAYKYNGPLIYFACYKSHIGLYPTPNGIEGFKEELSKYKGAKGSVQFPFNEPMPLDLIGRIVKYRMEQNKLKKEKTGK